MALIVTIIVLLILAGVSIATLAGNNGLISRTTIAKEATRAGEVKELVRLEAQANKIAETTNDTQKTRSVFIAELVADGKLTSAEAEEIQSAENPTITIGGVTIDFSILPEDAVQVWTQSGTAVTDGKITLTVGTQVTGYSVTGHTDLNWYVLGAKDGNLLITTNTCPETVELSGKDGFTSGIASLNATATNYSDGQLADSVNSIDYEDINRITGFNPKTANINAGATSEYGNKVTYFFEDDEKIWYQGTKNPTSKTASIYTSFEYWNGNSWITLEKGESSTQIECNYAYYDASSLDSDTKALLFTNTGNYPGDTGSYWIATPCEYCYHGYNGSGLHCVKGSGIDHWILFCSYGSSDSKTMGIRPVVSLKSSVKVSDTGVLTK